MIQYVTESRQSANMTKGCYIDTLFCVNWLLDAGILLLANGFLQRKVRFARISKAAILGSLWACGYVILTAWMDLWTIPQSDLWMYLGVILLHVALGLVNWLVVPWGMVCLAFPFQKFREGFRGVLCVYLSAVLCGGLIHMIWENTAFGHFWQLWMAGSDREAISLWLLMLAVMASFIAIESGRRYSVHSSRRQQIQEVTLYRGGRTYTVMALWDSGNQLYDPFTSEPVHILESSSRKMILGEDDISVEGMRLIPCRSLGSDHMLLPTISLDRMVLADGKILEHPRVGFSQVALSCDGSYQMLLHGQIHAAAKRCG